MKTGLFAAAVSLASTLGAALPPGFTDDLDAALREASSSGRSVLVDFTGSDWCGWCQRLDAEVFGRPEFLAGATNRFVLVQIDSPRDKSLIPERAREMNPLLVKKYNIHLYPSVLILDPAGRVVEKTSYRPGGPAAYLRHLDELLEDARRISVAEAAFASLPAGSAARARAIDALLVTLDLEGQKRREALVDEVLEVDRDGSLGLRAHYGYFVHSRPAEAYLARLQASIGDAFNKVYNAEFRGDGERYQALSEAEREKVDKRLSAYVASESLPAILSEHAPRVAEFRAASPAVPADARDHYDTVVQAMEDVLRNVRMMMEEFRPQEDGAGR